MIGCADQLRIAAEELRQVPQIPAAVADIGFRVPHAVEGVAVIVQLAGDPFCRVRHHLHQTARTHAGFCIGAEAAFGADDRGHKCRLQVVLRRIILNLILPGDAEDAIRIFCHVIIIQHCFIGGNAGVLLGDKIGLHQPVGRRQRKHQDDRQ